MRFDLITLELVLAIAEARSITAGAERAHLALAAASRRVTELEARLGVRLFERRARGVQVTTAGDVFVRHVRKLRASLNAMEQEVSEHARGVTGQVRLVANASAISEALPRDLAVFLGEHPGVRIGLEDQISSAVQRSVLDGSADVGVFVGPADPTLGPGRLHLARYERETIGPVAVALPTRHPLATRSALRFAELLPYELVGVHPGSSVHEMLLAEAQRLGAPMKSRLQVRGFDAIVQLVSQGLGLSVLPQHTAQRLCAIHPIAVVPLDEPWARREQWLAIRAGEGAAPPAARRLFEFLGAPAAAGAATTH